MRIELILTQPRGISQEIPVNYQYHISKMLYHKIWIADKEFSRRLHHNSLTSSKKEFRPFTFSRLIIKKRLMIKKPDASFLKILSPRIHLIISTPSDEVFKVLRQAFKLSSDVKIADARFKLTGYFEPPEYRLRDFARFKTISPVVLSKKVLTKVKQVPGKRNKWFKEIYLSPDNPDYLTYLKMNIREKFIAHRIASGHSLPFTLSSIEHANRIRMFNLLGDPKPALITIKENLPGETKVKAYSFDFEIHASAPILNFIQSAGIGKMNSLGFGCLAAK